MAKDVKKDLTIRDLGRTLGRKIARLERHVRELEVASQAAFRSVEDGAIDWYDDDGVLRERVGKQADGSYGRKTFTGDIPPAPTEPDVVVISDGVVAITWDGRWEERYSHVGWRNVQIHLGDTETFIPDRDTQVGAIFAPRGGTVVAVTESDDDNPVWVRLVGMNDAGQTGDPSVAVLVDELDEDDIDEEQEELQWEDGDGHTLTTEDIAAGTVTFPLTYVPEEKSLKVFLGGVFQRPVNYTVDYDAATVTFPLSAWMKVGHRISTHYGYFEDHAPEPVAIPFESSGWAFKIVAPTATPSSSPEAARDYNDSAWATGTAGFGDPLGLHTGIGTVTTLVAQDTQAVWFRRDIDGKQSYTIQVRYDGKVQVFWNGVSVYTTPSGFGTSAVIPVPDDVVFSRNVIAVYYGDSDGGPQGMGDVKIDGV